MNLQITKLKCEGSTDVDEDLYSLACRPIRRMRSYTACIINGVRYHTLAREEHRKTQNSTIKCAGTHNDDTIDFYGTIIDIIELSYSKNSKGHRTVILLRCEWYNLEGKTYQLKDDGYFKSINSQGRWYKNDPFIIATDASQVFFLEDTKLGPCWRVVQEFGHRHIFDVEETDTNQPIHEQVQMRCQEAYQEVHTSSCVWETFILIWICCAWIMNQAALLVETSSRASVDKNIQLKVMKHTAMMKMKMKPTLSTIVLKKAILQEKTVMMTDLCISGDL